MKRDEMKDEMRIDVMRYSGSVKHVYYKHNSA